MSRVVVTGGSGRLGRSVVAGLRDAGNTVLSVDRQPDTDPNSAVADLLDPAAAKSVLADFGAEAVVHLAAIATPFSAPERQILATNTMLAFTVAEAAVEVGVHSVIVASSPTVYGYGAPTGWVPEKLPLDEESPARPWNAYSLSKLAAESVVSMFAAQVGDRMRLAAFRPCYVIAPEEWRGALTQQGHTVAERLADPSLSAPALFNYLDARDAASFVVRLLERMDTIPNGETFIVGADDALAERPLAELLPIYHPGTRAAAGALTGTAPAFSNARAKRLLDWHPQYNWRDELVVSTGEETAAEHPRARTVR
ncbi:MAG TPA: NAD(P)-dependent oxidoreductase [Propionibacteriaceae bacterium]|nr:NAD(P)-dependent oxidoreductase [Propionibacteriaceae bacterium]